MSVGDLEIDRDHEKIIESIGQLAALTDSDDSEAIHAATTRLIVLLETHFRHEERILAMTSYPHAMAHKVEHRVLLHMARHMRGAIGLSRDPAFLRLSVRHFTQAVVEHMVEIDLGYRPYLTERGG